MLKIQNLTKHYPGSSKGITDLTLHVAPGNLYAFIGHNGAGKTTTLKAIAGIHNFDAGEIFVGGISLKGDPMACKQIMAYIPDSPELFGYLTGIQYLSFVADIFGLSPEVREARIRELAEDFRITGALGDLISSYSHGMKQKIAIISALIHEPKLLILDEPFVGLDPKAAVTLKEQMRKICQQGGAVFFSTHVLEVAQKLCDQVAIVKEGRLVVCGPMDQIVKAGISLEEIFLEVAADE